MAVFVARYSRNSGTKEPLVNRTELFRRYLPQTPSETATFVCGDSEAIVYKFGAALDRKPFVNNGKEVLLCHGYGDDLLEHRILRFFSESKSLNLSDFPEAFCAIALRADGIDFAGSAVGIDPLFFYEDDTQLVVTNRHNVLGYWAVGAAMRKQAFAWMVGRGHIGDFGTYWENIKKTRPGSLYTKTSNISVREIPVGFSDLFDPIEDGEIEEHISKVEHVFSGMLDVYKGPSRFWLSGGKDSRAIASLLSKADRFKEMTFHTHGESYAPDVMSAVRVAKELGVSGTHSVKRSSLTEPTVDLAKAIVRDLQSDSSGGSLADFRSISSSNVLVFGGHENGFKAPANTLGLEAYLTNRKYWADGMGVLRPDAYAEINGWYVRELERVLESAPKSRYRQLDLLLFRNGTYLTGAQVNSHISCSEIHPFLDGRMVRLLLGVTDNALDNQIIHYLMMRRSSALLESLPFAADGWPGGAESMAFRLGFPFRREPEQPFRYQNYFRSLKKFGGFSWRLQLIERSAEFVKDYIGCNQSFFDFIDTDKMAIHSKQDVRSLGITAIYYRLSLLKACLIHYFRVGDELFDFSQIDNVAQKVSSLFDATATETLTGTKLVESYRKKIDEYDQCLAKVAERDRESCMSEERAVNFKLASKLCSLFACDDSRLDRELAKLGFSLLPEVGQYIGEIKHRTTFQGAVLNLAQKPNTLLVAIKNRSRERVLEGFSWSDSGGFWFRYLNNSIDNPFVSIDVSDDDGNVGDFWIMRWYSSAPVYISKWEVIYGASA